MGSGCGGSAAPARSRNCVSAPSLYFLAPFCNSFPFFAGFSDGKPEEAARVPTTIAGVQDKLKERTEKLEELKKKVELAQTKVSCRKHSRTFLRRFITTIKIKFTYAPCSERESRRLPWRLPEVAEGVTKERGRISKGNPLKRLN